MTLLLGLMLIYWLMVVIGALDFEMDLFDFGDATPEIPDEPISHMGGAWVTAGRFLGFSTVPIAVWGSFLVLFMWAAALILNYQYNPDRSLGTAALLLLPNFLGSVVLTKIVTMPFGRLFKAMSDADTEEEGIVGRIGIVSSVTVDESYGQLQIEGRGAPLLINVRLHSTGEPLPKGAEARVVSAGPDTLYYFVEPVTVNPSL